MGRFTIVHVTHTLMDHVGILLTIMTLDFGWTPPNCNCLRPHCLFGTCHLSHSSTRLPSLNGHIFERTTLIKGVALMMFQVEALSCSNVRIFLTMSIWCLLPKQIIIGPHRSVLQHISTDSKEQLAHARANVSVPASW